MAEVQTASIGMNGDEGGGGTSGPSGDYGSFSRTPSPAHTGHTGLGGQGTTDGIAPNDKTIMAGDQYQKSPLIPHSGSEDDVRRDERYQSQGGAGDHPGEHLDTQDVKIDIEDSDQQLHFPAEPFKTLMAGLFLVLGFLCSTTGLALTHDRVPSTAPLPDIILDHVPYKEWALTACEVIIIISTLVAFVIVMLHSHRLIILRRVCLLLGLLYMYRGVTMFVTVLPKPDPEYACAPQLNQTTFTVVVLRVLKIVSGGGLSLSGSYVFCGDYIFSGHTVILTMGYMATAEYSPRRWYLLHYTSLAATAVGVAFLLLQRGHYSIDVVLAYWITSRLWYLYHTAAHNQQLKQRGGHNYLDRIWWWRIFRYFEGNVPGPLPRSYSLPLPKIVKDYVTRRNNEEGDEQQSHRDS